MEDADGNVVDNKKVITFPISWNEDGKSEITLYYMLDRHEVEEFHPKETWLSGTHLLSLYYPIMNLTANELHTFEVLISMKNGTGQFRLFTVGKLTMRIIVCSLDIVRKTVWCQ